MKKLLLALVPLALFAQVEIDTIIRLPTSNLGRGFFIPELNKLYVMSDDRFLVVDCSTYQVKAQIPRPYNMGIARYTWNWRRQKLYINVNPFPDSTLVIDASADSVIGWLSVYRETHLPQVYLSDLDRLYKSAKETLYAFDCSADTVARRILPPVPGYVFGSVSWDSAGRKLHVSLANAGPPPPVLAVYDYLADSFTAVLDVSTVNPSGINASVFNYAHRKAYFGPGTVEPWGHDVGILDTEHDTLLGSLPVRIWDGLHNQVVVNERDGKVYLGDNDADAKTPDTLWVVDCATDSVLKKVEYEPRGYGPKCPRWVPWSNRIYLSPVGGDSGRVVVLDCNTDSVVARLTLGDSYCAIDIQLDPMRERIFVIRADSNTIHVLRDTGYGIAESEATELRPVAGLQLRSTSSGSEVSYTIASPCRVELRVYDLMGRETRQLVAEQQSAGRHTVVWNCEDRDGNRAARGVYFIRLDTPGLSEVKKSVVAR